MKTGLLILYINIFLYLGYFVLSPTTNVMADTNEDFFSNFFITKADILGKTEQYLINANNENFTEFQNPNYLLKEEIIDLNKYSTDFAGIVTGGSFLDTIQIIWSVIKLLLTSLATPVLLFSVFGFPPLITLMFGIPLMFLWYLSIVFLIRGLS
jgi:hypothetical protein